MADRPLKMFKADMHIHSCLSPCGDWDMSPRRIIKKSLEVGLDLIAICDHNTVENAGVAIREGGKQGVQVLPGMGEICFFVFFIGENRNSRQQFRREQWYRKRFGDKRWRSQSKDCNISLVYCLAYSKSTPPNQRFNYWRFHLAS